MAKTLSPGQVAVKNRKAAEHAAKLQDTIKPYVVRQREARKRLELTELKSLSKRADEAREEKPVYGKDVVPSHNVQSQLAGDKFRLWQKWGKSAETADEWGNPNSGKRSVVAIEGRIHNTPVGSKVAQARPDSPFKRAKREVVIIRK